MIALQTQFTVPVASLCRLLNVHCARAMAGLNEDQALALAKMDWGFDISSGEAKAIELRLLPATLANYIATGGTKRLGWDWPAVSEALLEGAVKEHINPRLLHLGNSIKYLEGTTAQHILNCSSTHFMNLLSASQLRRVPGTGHSTGPNGTPKITVESFLEFLRKRKVRS